MLRKMDRQLGLRAATALVVGEVIGVGIFLTPAEMARALGSPLWLLVVWVTMGLLATCGAVCYGELACRFPEAGGGYVYLREAFGPRVAFLYGWMALLVLDPGLTAALAVGGASYAGQIIPLSPLGFKAVAIGAVLTVAVINARGVRLSAGLLQLLTGVKLGTLLLLVVWGFGWGPGSLAHFSPFVARHAGSPPLPAAMAGGLMGAFFAFAGWWDLSKVGGELRNPERDMPRALLLGLGIVTAVYLVTSAVFLYLVPIESVTSGETFAAQVGTVLFGALGGRILAAVVVISVLGSLAAFMTAAPRVYYSMARDGLFLSAVGQLHPRFQTPARAILLQSGLACVLIVAGTFQQIVAYFFFATVLFVALTVSGLFRLRRTNPGPAAGKAFGYPVTPILFLAFAVLTALLLLIRDARQALIGTAVVALGLPVYELVYRWRSSPQASR